MADGSIVFEAEVDNKEAQKDLNALEKSIERTQKNLSKMEGERSGLEEQFQRAGAAVDEARQKLKAMQAQLKEAQAAIDPRSGLGFNDISLEKYTEYRDISASLPSKIAEQEKEYQRLGAQADKLNLKLADYDDKINAATAELERQQNAAGELVKAVSDSGGAYEGIKEKAEKAGGAVEELAKDQEEVGDTRPIDRAASAYEKLRGILSRVSRKKREGETAVEAEKPRRKSTQKPSAQKAAGVDDEQPSRAAAAYAKLQGIMEKVAQAAKTMGSTVAKAGHAAGAAFLGAAKSAARFLNQMNVFSRVGQRLSGTFQRLGSLIKSAFVFNVISQGLTALKGQIASYLSTNAAFTAALNNLKGTLASAFQPILNVAVPALVTLINVISRVIATIGRFIGALFSIGGKSKANVKAMNAEAAAIGGAGAAAEEAAKSLASFDEINKLASESGGGGGGGGGGAGMEDIPEFDFTSDFASWGEAFDAFLDTIINKGIPQLRAAFESFANWLNGFSQKLYDMFTFPGVKEKVHIIGTELASAFNDLVNMINWQLLGQALGAGLNLALLLAVNAIYGFDWINLGRSLSALINGIVSEIEWYEFGRLLWAGFKIGLETFAGFIAGLDMPELAQAASSVVMGFFDSIKETAENIPWKEIGEKIAELLTNLDWDGMFKSVYEAIATTLGGLRDFIVSFLSGLGEWTKPLVDIVNTIADAIKKVMDITKKWASSLDFGPITKAFSSLGDAVSSLVSVISDGLLWAYENVLLPLAEWVIEDAAPILIDALATAIDFLAVVLERLKPVAQFIWENILKPLASFAWSVISGALELITSLLQKLTDLLSGNTTFSDFINSLSPAEAILLGVATALGVVFTAFAVMEVVSTIGAIVSGAITAIGMALNFLISPIGLVILAITGLVAGFVYLWQTSEGFREFWTGVWDAIVGAVKWAWEGITGFFESIGNALGSFWNFITGKQEETLDTMESDTNDFCDNVETKTRETYSGMEVQVSDSLDGMVYATQSSTEEMENQVNQKWDNMLDYTKISWDDIDETTAQVWEKMEEDSKQKFESISTNVRENWEQADEDSKDKWNGIDGLVNGIWSGMQASSELRFNGVKNNITSAWERSNSSTQDNFGNMQSEVESASRAMANQTDSAAKSILSSISTNLSASNTSTSTNFGMMEETTVDKTRDALNYVSTKFGEMEHTIDIKSRSAVDSVNTNFGKMEKTVTDNMNNAKSAAMSQDWGGVGRSIVDGMSAGVNERARALANSVANAANQAYYAAKRALQVNSPSKKTKWLFKMVMEGGVVGVKENAYRLINAMKGLSGQVMGAFQPRLSIPEVRVPPVPIKLNPPRLATGAVIPPNREFMAVLGDQRSGNNIEAPEELIRKIVREESGGGNTQLLQAILEAIRAGHVIMVDRQVLGKTVTREQNRMTRSSGRSALLT